MTEQLPLPEPCPRCGRRIQMDLIQSSRVAHQIDVGINSIRLAIPDRLKLQIRTLALTLPCLAGCCSREEGL